MPPDVGRSRVHAGGHDLSRLGIGLTTAMFSQIRSTVLRELPGTRERRADRPPAAAECLSLFRRDARSQRRLFRGGRVSWTSAGGHRSGWRPVAARLGASRDARLLRRAWGRGRRSAACSAQTNAWPAVRPPSSSAIASGARGSAAIRSSSDVRCGQRPAGDRHWRRPPGFLGASPTTAAADLWMPTTAPSTVRAGVARPCGHLAPPHSSRRTAGIRA